MPTRCATNFVCAVCKKNLSLQQGDGKYISFKCLCRILIIYPSGIVSEIDHKKYQKGYTK